MTTEKSNHIEIKYPEGEEKLIIRIIKTVWKSLRNFFKKDCCK